jgi:hypothetical protein
MGGFWAANSSSFQGDEREGRSAMGWLIGADGGSISK